MIAVAAAMRDIAYLSDRFPALSETFTRDEVRALRAEGLPLTVWSLHGPRASDPALEPARDPPVRYLPSPFSGEVLLSTVRWLARRPVRLLALLLTALFGGTDPFLPGLVARGPLHVAWGCWVASCVRRDAHLHAQFTTSACSVAHAAARLLDTTFSFTAHSEWGMPFLRAKLRAASLVVAVSEHERARLLARAPDVDPARIVVNRLGVDPAAWTVAPAQVDGGGPPALLSVGTLGPTKGHEVLLEACAMLRDRGLAFELDIVGGGPRRQLLEDMVLRSNLQDRVRLRGPLPHEQVRRLVARADVCVLACRQTRDGDVDGIPIVLMEAMAAGRATVSTRISAIPELIEDGVSGRLARPDDAGDLARVIEELLADPAQRARLGEAARARIAERFDGAASRRRLAALLRDVKGGHS